jgi:HAD superfamily hydrolase (TIGR01509 family)
MIWPVSGACLILDFDGTILDTEESLYRSWAELWAAHGQRLALADWQQNIGTDDVFDPLVELESRLGRPLHPDAQDRRRQRRDEIQARHGPRPGVLCWLAEAEDSGVPVGIASSSPLEWVEGHLDRLGLRGYFSCLVCRDAHVPAKPAPTSYLMACDRLGADPGRSVAVEDSPHGVLAAVAAGLFTVAVPHGLTSNLDLSTADLVVTSLDDLALSDALARAERPPGMQR